MNDDSSERSPQAPEPDPKPSFWAELRRRKVMRVAITYAVAAWLVIQIASVTFEGFGIPIWAFRFVMLCVILGFPLALILAWAFELTPEGIKTTKHAREERGEAPVSGSQERKRNWFSVIFAAAVPTVIFGALALFFYFRSGSDVRNEMGDLSIAVLPLENMSPDPDNAYFAGGVHEDILTKLSYIKSLRVIARTSVMRYEDTDLSIEDIAEELGVRYLVEGSVRRAGNLIKVTVQLIDSRSKGHLWANDYERELTAENVFKIQEEISLAITDSMKAVLSPEEKDRFEKLPTQNLAALEAYFKGMETLGERGIGEWSEGELSRGIEYLEQSIELDPQFALAHAKLANAYMRFVFTSGLDAAEQAAKAEPHVLKALEIDETLSEAYGALGGLQALRGDRDGAAEAYQKAIQLNTNNVLAYYEYTRFLALITEDYKNAVRIGQIAYELDPLNPSTHRLLAESLNLSDQFIRAVVEYRKIYEESPDDPLGPSGISYAYFHLGDMRACRRWADRALKLTSDPITQAKILKFAGYNQRRFEVAVKGLEASPRQFLLIWHLTESSIATGQAEKALAHMEREYPELLESEVEIDFYKIWQAKETARLLMATGRKEKATHLANIALAAGGSSIQRAALYGVLGDKEAALKEIRRFLDEGGVPGRLRWQEELEPVLQSPEYKAMIPNREAELAAQLERIREMEANGGLAPIPELPNN